MPRVLALLLNHMVQYRRAPLDASFAALSDATRRGVLEQLGRADASITELAEKFHMTLTGMKKHVGVLEQAGLATTERRVRGGGGGGGGRGEEGGPVPAGGHGRRGLKEAADGLAARRRVQSARSGT